MQLSSPPLASTPIVVGVEGDIMISTPGRIRTCNQRIRNPLLYPLSYGRKLLIIYVLLTAYRACGILAVNLSTPVVHPAAENPLSDNPQRTPTLWRDVLMAKIKTTTPQKPREDFPLFPHSRGYWAKKVRGKLHYFGKVADDPEGKAALTKWLDQKDDLLAGRTPRVASDGLTVRDLCNRFLTNRKGKMESGELSPISFADYHATCARIVKAFGGTRLVMDLDATDFEQFRRSMAKGWSPVTLANEIQRVRVVFRYAEQNQLIPVAIRYGSEFKKPSRKVLRRERQTKGLRMFEALELRAILAKATAPLKAMILLGANCGLGNYDITCLPRAAIDIKLGWLDFPRPKTAIRRRCPLWPETVAAIQEAIESRPKPKSADHAALLFITKYGQPWGTRTVSEPDKTGRVRKNADDPVCKEFNKLLTELKLKRPGLSFYGLRHTFETAGGDSRDQVAVDAIMGHTRDDMASVHRERIDDARLVAVTEHVRKWLFAEQETK
jgi:integrase